MRKRLHQYNTSISKRITRKKNERRVLVVDDEPDITFTLKEGLESGLFDVENIY